MVNYKRALCEGLVMLAFTGLVAPAPAPADCNDKQYHDQQQSGSENYRLSVANVIVAVAPLESLLLDFGDIDLSEKPKKPLFNKPILDVKPQQSKSPLKDDAAEVDPNDKPDLIELESPLGESQPSGEKEPNKQVKSEKQEKAQRLKMHLVNMLMPLLKRTAVTKE